MGDTLRKLPSRTCRAPLSGVAGLVAMTALLAGCSSDVSRFDFPAFGLTQQSPQARPAPSAQVYDYAAPAAAQGYSPGGAPPPDYNNGNYGDNADYGQRTPNYSYRGPAPGAPYANAAPAYGQQNYGTTPYIPPMYGNTSAPGFGTVQGQPESYHSESLASNGQTAYITNPPFGAPAIAEYSPAPLLAPASGSPAILPPIVAAQPGPIARRPKPGATVEVLPGETLYQFARRNGVSISALMQANNMRSPIVHDGDRLIIPGKGGRSILPPTASLSPLAPATPAVSESANAFASAAPVEPAAGDNPDGTYTVRAGDSVYGIARKHNMRPEDIMANNGITDVTKVKFGQVLRLPGAQKPLASGPMGQKAGARIAALQPLAGKPASTMTDAGAEGIPEGTTADAEDAAANPMTPVAGTPGKPRVVALTPVKPAWTPTRTGPKDPASAPIASAIPAASGPDMGNDQAADVPSDGRFRWPVRGRIIGRFGPTGKAGQQNEGVDLAVPLGTEVHAAENGVVAYAGDELKGYGKLVLIRHADNWVTAYAHNDELLVKRGDQIRRGQVIAKAGKSGGIDQPLLHFELRKGSQPVDPMPHMASN